MSASRKLPKDQMARCPWAGADRCISTTTTLNGVFRTPTISACSRSWCSKASRPASSWITILRKRENFRRAFHGVRRQEDRALHRDGRRAPAWPTRASSATA